VRGTDVALDGELAKSFIADCARYTEGLLNEQELREAWGPDEQRWVQLAENTAFATRA
jgi:hypothetical protein